MPNATLDQRIATGFQRCNVTTNEAGIIEDEYAEIYAKDRADTFGSVFLGLTVGCATCHDHKFDPISQKDYYSLGAFFRNTPQKVMDGNTSDQPPFVIVPRQEDRAKLGADRRAPGRHCSGDVACARLRPSAPFETWLRIEPRQDSTKTLRSTVVDLIGDRHRRPALFRRDRRSSIGKPPKLDAEKPFTIAVNFPYSQGRGLHHRLAAELRRTRTAAGSSTSAARLIRFRSDRR